MKKTMTGWILFGMLAGGGVAWAGPQVADSAVTPLCETGDSHFDAIPSPPAASATPAVIARPTSAGNSVAFSELRSGVSALADRPTAPLTPAYDAGSAYDPSTEQHPMIPLPPALWASLISLSAVAYHTIRKQRSTRLRN
jgi:hypothetical protein